MTGWTLDELAGRVANVLAATDVRAPNARVTEVPDGRLIRWYATIGLVDRPVMRGRLAVYGPRHLLQLVAVKRRQAQGHALAEIQTELAGATDAVLRRVAALPPHLLDGAASDGAARDGAAGVDVAADGAATAAGSGGAAQNATAEAVIRLPRSGPGRRPADHPDQAQHNAGAQGDRGRFWTRPSAVITDAEVADSVGVLYGIQVGGVTLLLPAAPHRDDLAAIRAAAAPLLDLLAARGLLNSPTAPRPEGAPA